MSDKRLLFDVRIYHSVVEADSLTPTLCTFFRIEDVVADKVVVTSWRKNEMVLGSNIDIHVMLGWF